MTSDELLQKYLIVIEKLVVVLERQNLDLGRSLKNAENQISELKKGTQNESPPRPTLPEGIMRSKKD